VQGYSPKCRALFNDKYSIVHKQTAIFSVLEHLNFGAMLYALFIIQCSFGTCLADNLQSEELQLTILIMNLQF
jgi:hypothetical protein